MGRGMSGMLGGPYTARTTVLPKVRRTRAGNRGTVRDMPEGRERVRFRTVCTAVHEHAS